MEEKDAFRSVSFVYHWPGRTHLSLSCECVPLDSSGNFCVALIVLMCIILEDDEFACLCIMFLDSL